jgi:hypothetical protein
MSEYEFLIEAKDLLVESLKQKLETNSTAGRLLIAIGEVDKRLDIVKKMPISKINYSKKQQGGE